MGYHDPREFWRLYHRTKEAVADIDRLPASARRRVRAALVRRLCRGRSDLADRLEPGERRLVDEAWFGFQMAARRCSGGTSDARTDRRLLDEFLAEFLGPLRGASGLRDSRA